MKISALIFLCFLSLLSASCGSSNRTLIVNEQPTFDEFGRTELIRAVIKGNETPIYDALFAYPKWKDHKDKFGMNALHYAASTGNERGFQILIQQGVLLTQKDNANETVMHKFARLKMNAPIQFLKLKGLSVDESNKQGMNPLHIAASGWNAFQVERFLLQKANINIQNAQGKTALHLAIDAFPGSDSLEVTKLRKDLLVPPPDTVKLGYWIMTKKRFSKWGKDFVQFFKNIPDLWKKEPLLLKQEKNGLETVELLLSYSPDLRIRDAQGETVLVLAKKKQHYELTKLLIKRGLIKESDL